MGLDMYIYGISTPELIDCVYEAEYLYNNGYIYRFADELDSRHAELLPFAAKAQVRRKDVDLERIIADYGLPAKSCIGCFSRDGITVGGITATGSYARATVSYEDIKTKYATESVEDCYVWRRRKLAQWRKNYDIQDFWYQTLDRDVENGGYCKLDEGNINAYYDAEISQQYLAKNDDEVLFYHESY